MAQFDAEGFARAEVSFNSAVVTLQAWHQALDFVLHLIGPARWPVAIQPTFRTRDVPQERLASAATALHSAYAELRKGSVRRRLTPVTAANVDWLGGTVFREDYGPTGEVVSQSVITRHPREVELMAALEAAGLDVPVSDSRSTLGG